MQDSTEADRMSFGGRPNVRKTVCIVGTGSFAYEPPAQ